MPAYYTGDKRPTNNIGSALAGIANTYANATSQRDEMAQQGKVRDAQIAQSNSAVQKALAEAGLLNQRKDARGRLAENLSGVDSGIEGLSGSQYGDSVLASDSIDFESTLASLADRVMKGKASEGFAENPSQAAFDANIAGVKVDSQYSQNSDGQVLSNFGGGADSSSGLAQSKINSNNASAFKNRQSGLLDQAKAENAANGVVDPVQALKSQKLQLEVDSLTNKGEESERVKQNAVSSAMQAAENIRGRVAEAKDLVGGSTAGPIAAITANIPGFAGYDLANKISTIQSNLGIDELLRIKAAGGTFGALSDRELSVLQNKIANLTQTQDPEVLRQELDVIDQQYARAMQALGSENGQGEDAPNTQATIEQAVDATRDSIENGSVDAPQVGMVDGGYEFLGGDPSNPSSWRQVGEATTGGF
jgi:hypothetical protein